MEQRLIDVLPIIKELENSMNFAEKIDAPHSKGVLRECIALLSNSPTVEPVQSRRLTLKELYQMDGQPVWIIERTGEWALVDIGYESVLAARAIFHFDDYGVDWTAYTSPPSSTQEGNNG